MLSSGTLSSVILYGKAGPDEEEFSSMKSSASFSVEKARCLAPGYPSTCCFVSSLQQCISPHSCQLLVPCPINPRNLSSCHSVELRSLLFCHSYAFAPVLKSFLGQAKPDFSHESIKKLGRCWLFLSLSRVSTLQSWRCGWILGRSSSSSSKKFEPGHAMLRRQISQLTRTRRTLNVLQSFRPSFQHSIRLLSTSPLLRAEQQATTQTQQIDPRDPQIAELKVLPPLTLIP